MWETHWRCWGCHCQVGPDDVRFCSLVLRFVGNESLDPYKRNVQYCWDQRYEIQEVWNLLAYDLKSNSEFMKRFSIVGGPFLKNFLNIFGLITDNDWVWRYFCGQNLGIWRKGLNSVGWNIEKYKKLFHKSTVRIFRFVDDSFVSGAQVFVCVSLARLYEENSRVPRWHHSWVSVCLGLSETLVCDVSL